MAAKQPCIVYRYTTESDHYESLDPATRYDVRTINRFHDNKSLRNRWKPFTVKRGSKKKAGDFPAMFGFGDLPIVSERAWESLRGLIEDVVEALPINHPSGKPYFAINVLDVVSALDLKKSKPKCFSNGSIMSVEKCWFKERLIRNKHIFRVPEFAVLKVFVSPEFKALVEAEGLRGVRFPQVYPPLSRAAQIACIRSLRLP